MSADDGRMSYVTNEEQAAWEAAGSRLSRAEDAFTEAAPEDADARWQDVGDASAEWHDIFNVLFRRSLEREREADRQSRERVAVALSAELESQLREGRQ